MLKLYKMNWDCGRMGDVIGIFVAEEETVAKAIGKRVYFGEILGKHSEVYGELEERDLTILTDNPDFIKEFKKYIGISFGYSPLEYMSEEQ